jgi:hypothetical protein
MRFTNSLEIASPNPVPPYLRVLEPSASAGLHFGMVHERVLQHSDDRGERDHGDQQKGEDQFSGQGHGIFIPNIMSPILKLNFT